MRPQWRRRDAFFPESSNRQISPVELLTKFELVILPDDR